MQLSNLTPQTQLQLHLAKANEYWRADRLDLALAAVKAALDVGLHPGHWYSFQRTVEAEWGARQAGRRIRVEESLVLETDPRRWGAYWPRISQIASDGLHFVTEALHVHWGKPVLLTFIPDEEWMEFTHSRFGFYTWRTESHKVCLPPSTVIDAATFSRAARHEITHAAVNQLAGESVPRWLNEGLAVNVEGPAPQRFHSRKMRLNEISAGFESFEVDIGSGLSHECYAQSAAVVGGLIQRHGLSAMAGVFRRIGQRDTVEKAVERGLGERLEAVEQRWLNG